MTTTGCSEPPVTTTGATVSTLDGGITLSLPSGWEQVALPEEEEEGTEASVFRTRFAYPEAGTVLVSAERELPAAYVEVSGLYLRDDGARYIEEGAALYEMVYAAFPESGHFVHKDFGGTRGYYGLFYDTGGEGFLGPWITTYLTSTSGKDIIIHLQFQLQESWYQDNKAAVEQIVDSLKINPPYSGDVTELDTGW
jgi:hypothetical protein